MWFSSPWTKTLLSHLKRYPIHSKLLLLALESFGHATKNWNLFSVNVAMAGTGLYQLSRKIRKDYFSDQKDDVASLEG
uniref:Mitochondrial pyruvate carrier n=1 Tax=Oryza glumipatula TaxID=40148 RepID=A0A0E0AUB7_9ORYZ